MIRLNLDTVDSGSPVRYNLTWRMEEAIEQYLAGDVYWGESHFRDKDEVKQHCGTTRQRRYDRAQKLWGTTSLNALQSLIESGSWWPVGIDRTWKVALWNNLSLRVDEKSRVRSEEAERISSLKRARSTVEVIPKIERERRAAMKDILPCEEGEIATLAAFGVSTDLVQLSVHHDSLSDGRHLGPWASISASARILRLFKFEATAARFGEKGLTQRYEDLTALLVQDFSHTNETEAATSVLKQTTVQRQSKRQPPTLKTFIPAMSKPCNIVRSSRPLAIDIVSGECRRCFTRISVQFMSCLCVGEVHHETWQRCDACHRLVNPLLDGCPHYR